MNDYNALCPDSWTQTIWERVSKGCGEGDAAQQARKELLVRYHEVVQRYFRAQIRDPYAADELYSNFALKLMQSDRLIRNADPGRGRFRHYLKAALRHMVIDYYRRKAGDPISPIDPDGIEGEGRDPVLDPIVCRELLDKAWAALQAHDRATGQHHYPVLRCQSDNPELRSPQLADQLTARLGKTYTREGVRQALRRARAKFAELLLQEAERWLESPTLDELEAELAEMQLLQYCARALKERRQGCR